MSSLGDFLEFKKVMLAKKQEKVGGGGSMQMIDKGVLDVEGYMDQIETLKQEANVDEGWTQILNEETCAVFQKKTESGDSLLRCTLEFDLTPKHCCEMMFNTDPESLTWKKEAKAIEIVE